jgi:hypothetical protein
MKIKKIAKLCLILFVVSSFMTIISLIYLKIKSDSSPNIVYNEPNFLQKRFTQNELNLILYRKDNKFYFYKSYFQFLILQEISFKRPQLLYEGISFYYDDLLNPQIAKVIIGENDQYI